MHSPDSDRVKGSACSGRQQEGLRTSKWDRNEDLNIWYMTLLKVIANSVNK